MCVSDIIGILLYQRLRVQDYTNYVAKVTNQRLFQMQFSYCFTPLLMWYFEPSINDITQFLAILDLLTMFFIFLSFNFPHFETFSHLPTLLEPVCYKKQQKEVPDQLLVC